MADTKNINVFIDTSIKDVGQTNYSLLLSLPDNYINCKDNQGLHINLVSFCCVNSFNNCNQYNNTFTILKTSLTDVVIGTYVFNIPYGSYNVYTFRDYINSICSTYFNMSYNSNTNSYSIVHTLVDTNVKIKIIMNTAGVFFGLSNNTTTVLTTTPYTTSYVNMTGWNKIIMRVKGIQYEDPCIDNILSNAFEESEVLFWVSQMDTIPFSQIVYNDEDNGDLFNFKIHNKHVKNIILNFTDENGNILYYMPNWNGIIQFEVYNHNNDKQTNTLNKIEIRLRMISTWFLMVLEFLKII